MFKKTHKELKTAQQALTVPKGCRELSDEEMFKVNGGAEEKKESQESKSESVTVQSGNTLSGIVNDYNKANGTNYTVSEVAKNSGISNPDLIYSGQEIKFGNQESTRAGASSQNTIQSSPSISGNSTGSYSGSSTLNSVSASTTTPSLESTKKLMYSKSLTGQSVSVDSCLSAPKYDDSTFKEKVENYMTQAESKKIEGKAAMGKMANGNQSELKTVDAQNISSDSWNRGYPSTIEKYPDAYKNSKNDSKAEVIQSASWGKLKTSEAKDMRMQDYKYYENEDAAKQKEVTDKNALMNGNNYFNLSGCKMCGTAKIASEVAGHKIDMKDDINDKYDANADGNMSLEESGNAIRAQLAEGKTLKTDWFEKTLSKETLDEIAGWEGTTYILGKAENVYKGEPHWEVLTGYSINELGQVQFDYSPTSKYDSNRNFILGDVQSGQTDFFKIVKIETFTIQ